MTDKKGIVMVASGDVPEHLIELVSQWKRAEEQVEWFSSYQVAGHSDEVRFLFNLYISGLNHSLRKQFIKSANTVFEASSNLWLEDFVFSQFVNVPENRELDAFLTRLTACVDGPDSSSVTGRFASWLKVRTDTVVTVLVELLSGWVGRQDTPLLMISRLIQSIIARFPTTKIPANLKQIIVEILERNHEDSSRDLVTVVGYLLCFLFPDERFDRPDWRPLPRMSIRRALVAIASGEDFDFSASLEFYASFLTADCSAMDLHYAIQSLNLLLMKSPVREAKKAPQIVSKGESSVPELSVQDGLRITDICLVRWDHTLHMISANCRSLFGQLCSRASPALSAAIAGRARTLEAKSKKRFNLIFGLLAVMPLTAIVTDDLVQDVLGSLQRWCPCVTAAGGLLEMILTKADLPLIQSVILAVQSVVEENIDWDQLLGAFLKASRVRKDGICPFTLLVSELALTGSELTILRVLQHVLISGSAIKLVIADGAFVVEGKSIFTIEKLSRHVMSSDPGVVAVAIAVTLRALLKTAYPELWLTVKEFLTLGGPETITGSKDDRSVVLQELKRLFDKSGTQDFTGKTVDTFRLVWQRALQPNALQEECLLQIELMSQLRFGRIETLIPNDEERNELMRRLVENGLTSRWRKVRACSKILWNSLPSGFSGVEFSDKAEIVFFSKQLEEDLSEELAGVLFESISFNAKLVTGESIRKPNVNLLVGLANTRPDYLKRIDSRELEAVIPHLLATVVYHSQFVGENCLEAVFLNASGLLDAFKSEIDANKFEGSVDCRGHPILGSDEESTAVSVYAWTCAKSACLALQAIISVQAVSETITMAKILAILLLSVKHPAEIAPLESVFSFTLKRLTSGQVEEELLLPLVGTVTGVTPGAVFPLPQALRRSQGLGPLISSIVKSQNSSSVLQAVTERLLSVINLADSEDEQVLHCMNILRAMVRDSTIPDEFMDSVVGDILLSGIDILYRLSGDFWRIRSSATQLFVQAARRFIGADNEEDWFRQPASGRKKISAKEFFFNRTGGGDRLVGELVSVLSNSDSEFVVVPILAVIRSLSQLGELAENKEGKILIETIRKGVGNKSCHVRRLASKIVARMLLEGDGRIEEDLNISGDEGWNLLHGKLIIWSYLARMGWIAKFSVQEILSSPQVKQLVYDEAAIIAVYTGQTIAVDKRYRQWILSLDEADIVKSEALAKAVVRALDLASDPVGRELMVTAITSFPNLVSSAAMNNLLNLWLNAKYNLGTALMVNLLGEDCDNDRVHQWLLSVDLLSENNGSDLKSILAKTALVRQRFSHLHAMLCLDESAYVRQCASVDGKNAILSFASVAEKCDDEFLYILLGEPFEDHPSDSIMEYCLRTQAREIAGEILENRRQH